MNSVKNCEISSEFDFLMFANALDRKKKRISRLEKWNFNIVTKFHFSMVDKI